MAENRENLEQTAFPTAGSQISEIITDDGSFDLEEHASRIASLVSAQPSTPASITPPRPGTIPLPTGNEPVTMGTGVVKSLVASGTLTRIYKIWNQELEEFRIIKLFLSPDQVNLRKRFETEAKICAKLRHPNIVSLFSAGLWKGLPFIEMEYVNGESLAQVLRRHVRLPERVALSIGVAVARALAYAHSREIVLYGKKYRGIIHRDLKPGNIIISSDGQIKLTDFGVAAPPNLSIHQTIDNGLVVGTMPYLAPEQMEGAVLDQSADIYSFGAVLYEMLTGTRTFPSENVTELIRAKTANQFRSLGEFDLGISEGVQALINRCLEYDKSRRFREGAQLLEALIKVRSLAAKGSTEFVTREFISSRAPATTSVPANGDRKKPRSAVAVKIGLVAALALTVIVVAGAVSVVVTSRRSGHTQTQPSTATILESELEQSLVAQTPSGSDLEKRVAHARSLMDRHLYTDATAGLEELARTNPGNKLIDLYLLDCYVALRETEKAWTIAARTDLNDGNFDLIKGFLEQRRGNTAAALALFSSAATKGSVVRNPMLIRRDAVYFSAMVLTTAYEGSQNHADLRRAISAWEMVKKEYEATPTHPRFATAERRLRQLLELPYE